ncbi:metallophosphoesterase [Pseudochrobactrum sp. sp1633]|uniref:metallophosphoesterase n=1 Tax=Pseudochrobactrum sp. sp1633 TaxID=3036706 RepID=UPI0025A57FC5|nr:metallophosphoesterase [Pseudochrobactrum sp. sp1633]MDM8344827.1 metallophosphoesterase [Pseudochrobactrum sp. sp1633]
MPIIGFDIIGDIHGNSEKLHKLLNKLGYTKNNNSNGYTHSERKVIFLGDFIDRGPQQLDTVLTAKAMIESGSALAVMGNHEYNAICYATPNPHQPNDYLRTHLGDTGKKNFQQHAAFLNGVQHDAVLYDELISFFKTLPLWLEIEDIRIVHACWNVQKQKQLRPYLTNDNCLTETGIVESAKKGSTAFEATELLLKGLELTLPKGVKFQDADGHERQSVRVKWWDSTANDYASLALLPEAITQTLPKDTIPNLDAYRYNEDTLLFIGHYWLTGKPRPLSSNVICVDYSAGKGGDLVAYRHDIGQPFYNHMYVST